MEGFFLQVLNRSITAGWLILVVVLVRFLFRKAPKWIRGVLWGMVALRLVIPFAPESEFSLLPNSQSIESVIEEKTDSVAIPVTHEVMMREEYSAVIPVGGADTHGVRDEMTMTQGVNVLSVVTVIWLTGACVLLLYCLLSFGKLRRRVADAVIYRKKKPFIYQSEKVDSPFVLGLIKPCIYLPYGISDEDRECVVAHEEAHISRGDHLIKPIGFLILAVYWFQPLVWLAYILLCRDIELACDEKVIGQMSLADKKAYTKALLECSKPQHMISACPLAFGEVGVKKRITNVLHYKKPAFWIILLSILACVIVAVCFLTEPKEKPEDNRVDLNNEEADSYSQQQALENQEELKREEVVASFRDTELINAEKENSEKSVKPLTTPPTMYLQDALSSTWNEFPINSSTYGWSYRDEEGKVLCIDAAAKHGVSGEVKGKEWLQVYDYSRHDAWYGARFEVWPDSMNIREYDLLDLGDMNPELLAEKTNERVDFLELKPRRMYEITATWQEDKFEERGFSGTAVYVFATDNYAVSGTELQGEELPIFIEAHIKETMPDTKDRICISSDSDSFPGAFIVIVPEAVYDKSKLQGGQSIYVIMRYTGEKENGKLSIYEAVYLQPVEEVGEIKTMPGVNLPSVRERWTEEVNTFDEAELLFEKYTSISGDLELVNHSDRDFQYGEWFDIQRKVDDEWYSLSYIIENVAFHEIAYNMPAGETSIKPTTWEWMYGELPPGKYRIVTDVIDYRAPGDFDKYYLAEEFEIMQ